MQRMSALRGRTNFFKSLVQIEPGKPAIAQGLRTAVAVGGSLLVGLLVGHASMGMTMAFSAILVSLTDTGGHYRAKAIAMGAATFGVAVSALVGTLVGAYPWLTIPLVFLWGFSTGFAGVYGGTAAVVGLVVFVSFLSGISQPGNLAAAMNSFGQFIAGGVWTMVLSLFAWPLKPYQPLQDALADCYKAIAAFVAAEAEILTPAPVAEPEQWQHTAQLQQQVRNALEVTRNMLVATRMTQQGTSTIGVQLLVLFEMAERIFDAEIALVQVLETTISSGRVTEVPPLVKDALEQMAAVTRAISRTLSSGKNTAVDTSSMDYIVADLKKERQTILTTFRARQLDYPFLRDISNLIQLVEKLSQQIYAAVAPTKSLCTGERRIINGQVLSLGWKRTSIVAPLRTNLTWHSVAFRHALRLSLTATLAVIAYTAFNLQNVFWITLSIVVILKPNFGDTFKRAFQRVGGTILGGFFAAVLAATLYSQFILAAVIVLLAFAITALMPLNYGLAVVFITPLAVLLTSLTHPGNWQMAGIRVLNTTFGSALAFLGGYALWPSWERQRLSQQLVRTLRANQTYCQLVLAAYLNREDTEAIWAARRQADLENTNAASSLERLLSEPQRDRGSVESVMIVVTYMERFSDVLTTLFAHLDEFSGQYELPGLETFAQQTDRALSDLADAVGSGNLPPALPPLDAALRQIHVRLEELYALRSAELLTDQTNTPTQRAVLDYAPISKSFDQIAEQVAAMHSALTRMFS